MKIKTFESFNSDFEIYDYFSDIIDEDEIKLNISEAPPHNKMSVYFSDEYREYKNPMLNQLLKTILKKKNILSRAIGSKYGFGLNDMGFEFHYVMDERNPSKILRGLKSTDLIKWIEESSNYVLVGGDINRGKEGYWVRMIFDRKK